MSGRSAMPNVGSDMVMVLWLDSSGQDGWRDVQEAKELPSHSMQCLSVGWVLSDDDEALVIAPHAAMNKDKDFDSVRGHLAIPRVAIERVEIIQKANSRAKR